MSNWKQRFWSGGFSPFATTEYPPNVTEDDYSYITHEEADESLKDNHINLDSRNPSANDDILVVLYRGAKYPLHFKPYSIDDGLLRLRHVREALAHAVQIEKPERIRLIYRGDVLKDSFTCQQYKLRRGAELMADILDLGTDDPKSDSGTDEMSVDQEGQPDKRRRRRDRSRNKNKKTSPDRPTPGAQTLAPPGNSTGTSRSASPSAKGAPKTALEKIEDLSILLKHTFLPEAETFWNNLPSDPAKLDMEYRKLSEMILAQVLLKTDAIETEGNPEARQKRKDLVKDTQQVLARLDTVAKKTSSL
ncbi:MAG: hypothetical protein M1814_005628 [Vezdaea aestivalis]|nr:MAG: hypothetical protein M1814_005628 [Vezdaea aestivalis]